MSSNRDPARIDSAMNSSFLRDVLSGRVKPRSEKEAIKATTALMWIKVFAGALKPIDDSVEKDPLVAPQGQAIKDAQAQWMGIEAAVAFGDSISSQLSHIAKKSVK